MKRIQVKIMSMFILPLAVLTACNSGNENTEETTEPTCQYQYNGGSTTFEWTAFKFADKSGAVPGTFDNIVVESGSYEDPKEVIESITFRINTEEVNSQNEDRDAKISKFFFETINTKEITGKFKELKDDGKAVVEINMNGIAFDVEGDYTLDGADFTFESAIDVSAWNGMAGIVALNKECEELHRKAPGEESKLWSEVLLKLSTKLKSDC